MTIKNTGFGRRQPAPIVSNVPIALPKTYIENRKPDIRASQFKKVKLIFNNGYCTFDAILRELSDHGAKIESPDALNVPDTFTLHILQSGIQKTCYLIWRDNHFIGVSFKPFH
ncbi:MAG: hypothetical protein COA43_04140 [Robiginitomaculum sp.]|nr:MAG: hypothetical protein COA43_04140 [Robiginitomaculum sp.]